MPEATSEEENLTEKEGKSESLELKRDETGVFNIGPFINKRVIGPPPVLKYSRRVWEGNEIVGEREYFHHTPEGVKRPSGIERIRVVPEEEGGSTISQPGGFLLDIVVNTQERKVNIDPHRGKNNERGFEDLYLYDSGKGGLIKVDNQLLKSKTFTGLALVPVKEGVAFLSGDQVADESIMKSVEPHLKKLMLAEEDMFAAKIGLAE